MWAVPILINAGWVPLVTSHSLKGKRNHHLDTKAMLFFVTPVIGSSDSWSSVMKCATVQVREYCQHWMEYSLGPPKLWNFGRGAN